MARPYTPKRGASRSAPAMIERLYIIGAREARRKRLKEFRMLVTKVLTAKITGENSRILARLAANSCVGRSQPAAMTDMTWGENTIRRTEIGVITPAAMVSRELATLHASSRS